LHFEKQERHDHQVELYITLGLAMLEKCARLAEKMAEANGLEIAAAIRKLKDEP
jgi:hypothetical protein